MPRIQESIKAKDLEVYGELKVYNRTDVTSHAFFSDRILELGYGAEEDLTNTNITDATGDAGLIIQRGSADTRIGLIWDESAEKWIFGENTSTGTGAGTSMDGYTTEVSFSAYNSIQIKDLNLIDIAADSGGPILTFEKERVVAATTALEDEDSIGKIVFKGRDDTTTPAQSDFASIETKITDASSSSKNASTIVSCMAANESKELAIFNPESYTAATFCGGLGYRQPVFTGVSGTLTKAMSGCTLVCTAESTIRLPAVTAADLGIFYKFIYMGTTTAVIIQAGGAEATTCDFSGGVLNIPTGNAEAATKVGAVIAQATDSTFTFSDAIASDNDAKAGSWITVTCIATGASPGDNPWFVDGVVYTGDLDSDGTALFT